MASHVELLVEELSMEAFLRALLPRLLPRDRTFGLHAFQGKSDLMNKLEARLRGYASWMPSEWRIVVVVDRDDEDCRQLKQRLQDVAARAGLRGRTGMAQPNWQLVNRIVIEELEAWYFGDWQAVTEAYPRVPLNIPRRQQYRDPDGIAGGTWEAFERVLQQSGYFQGGLAKIEAARTLGDLVDARRNHSTSFRHFRDAVLAAVS